jgi:hypothetical protein
MNIRLENNPGRELPTNPQRIYRGSNGQEYHWAVSGDQLRGQLFQREGDQLSPIGETLAMKLSNRTLEQTIFFAAAKGCFREDQ